MLRASVLAALLCLGSAAKLSAKVSIFVGNDRNAESNGAVKGVLFGTKGVTDEVSAAIQREAREGGRMGGQERPADIASERD